MYDLDRIWRGANDTIAHYTDLLTDPDYPLEGEDLKETVETLALAYETLDLCEALERKYYALRRESLYA